MRAYVFRYSPDNGHRQHASACPFRAISGHRAYERDCQTIKMFLRQQPLRFAGRSVATTFLAGSDPTVEQ
jgi:hypothetical protein